MSAADGLAAWAVAGIGVAYVVMCAAAVCVGLFSPDEKRRRDARAVLRELLALLRRRR